MSQLLNYTEEEILRRLGRAEGQYSERKSLWHQHAEENRCLDRRTVRDFIAVNVAAFANADGGLLILGAEDDGTPSGHGYPDEATRDFFEVPERRLQPAVPVRVQRLMVQGKELLLLGVDSAPSAVMVVGNGFPYRSGHQVVKLQQQAINATKQEHQLVSYEAQFRSEANLHHLDAEKAEEFFKQSGHGHRSLQDNLCRFGLAEKRGDTLVLRNAALLLFAKGSLSRWYPKAGVRLFRVSGNERKHGAERNVRQLDRFEAPLPSLIEQTHRFVRSQIRNSEKLHDLFFREMPEYPEFAWQEAVVNAVAHRDYRQHGNEIEIWFYDDRMEVISPGETVGPVNVQALQQRKAVHASRNPLIARILTLHGTMREEGEGIPRMFDEMESSLLQPPQFEVGKGCFRVTLLNTPIFEAGQPEWTNWVQRQPLSDQQKRILVAKGRGQFSNSDYQELNEVDRDTAYREIQEMVTAGFLEPTGKKGRGAAYRLAPEKIQESSWLAARLPQLREYFKDNDHLTNSDYRDLFDVKRYEAYRELKTLLEAGYVERTGKRKGTKYWPADPLEE